MNVTKKLEATPRWTALIEVILAILENKKAPETAKVRMRNELRRMAQAADSYVETRRPRRKYERKAKGGAA